MEYGEPRIAMLRIKHEGEFFVLDTPDGKLLIHQSTARILIEYMQQHMGEKGQCHDVSFSSN